MKALGRGRQWAGFLVVAICLAAVGCNSSSGTVSGKVYYGDELVRGGTVTFLCADGRAIPTGIREDGSYTVDQVPLGTAKICVNTSALDPRRKPLYSAPLGRKVELPGMSEPDAKRYRAIPPRYAALATTDLTCEVAGGGQRHDIKMK